MQKIDKKILTLLSNGRNADNSNNDEVEGDE